ncbi:TRAP transporter substrate-binding protein [Nonomuraea sp. NPDC059194]|uniref:TRAP transporter substrate-binding protein n=1 Tax=Nonomuraea sp. NPDC059194 TaxID=3346764 RepID=UPI0036996B20
MVSTGRPVVVLALAAGLVAACTGTAGGGGKAGTAAVTLTIGTDDSPGRPGAAAVEEFARQVRAESGGEVVVEPRWQAAGKGRDDWDQAVARMVVGGRLDLALVPARTWDTEGVSTMSALHAPFLVTSDALVDRVVSDADLAEELLGGLAGKGLTGLALVPENLRHPFGFGRALTSPGDFAGRTFRAPRSETAYALFRALGGEPDDLPGDRFGRALAAGTVSGAESSFVWADDLPAKAVGVGNVTFFPKVNSLVIRSSVLAGLSDRQRAALDTAAERTVAWAIRHRVAEGDGALAYCGAGGSVVLASAADLRALDEAARPVYASLERDPPTKAMIERIRTLKRQTPPPPALTPCAARPTADPVPSTAAASPRFPEGIYRAEIPLAFLIERGVRQDWARDNAGISTLTFRDGTWRHNVGGTPADTDCYGPYAVKDGTITLSFREVLCGTMGGDLFSAAWTVDGDQLRFVDLVAGQPGEERLMTALFGAKPWTRIG